MMRTNEQVVAFIHDGRGKNDNDERVDKNNNNNDDDEDGINDDEDEMSKFAGNDNDDELQQKRERNDGVADVNDDHGDDYDDTGSGGNSSISSTSSMMMTNSSSCQVSHVRRDDDDDNVVVAAVGVSLLKGTIVSRSLAAQQQQRSPAMVVAAASDGAVEGSSGSQASFLLPAVSTHTKTTKQTTTSAATRREEMVLPHGGVPAETTIGETASIPPLRSQQQQVVHSEIKAKEGKITKKSNSSQEDVARTWNDGDDMPKDAALVERSGSSDTQDTKTKNEKGKDVLINSNNDNDNNDNQKLAVKPPTGGFCLKSFASAFFMLDGVNSNIAQSRRRGKRIKKKKKKKNMNKKRLQAVEEQQEPIKRVTTISAPESSKGTQMKKQKVRPMKDTIQDSRINNRENPPMDRSRTLTRKPLTSNELRNIREDVSDNRNSHVGIVDGDDHSKSIISRTSNNQDCAGGDSRRIRNDDHQDQNLHGGPWYQTSSSASSGASTWRTRFGRPFTSLKNVVIVCRSPRRQRGGSLTATSNQRCLESLQEENQQLRQQVQLLKTSFLNGPHVADLIAKDGRRRSGGRRGVDTKARERAGAGRDGSSTFDGADRSKISAPTILQYPLNDQCESVLVQDRLPLSFNADDDGNVMMGLRSPLETTNEDNSRRSSSPPDRHHGDSGGGVGHGNCCSEHVRDESDNINNNNNNIASNRMDVVDHVGCMRRTRDEAEQQASEMAIRAAQNRIEMDELTEKLSKTEKIITAYRNKYGDIDIIKEENEEEDVEDEICNSSSRRFEDDSSSETTPSTTIGDEPTISRNEAPAAADGGQHSGTNAETTSTSMNNSVSLLRGSWTVTIIQDEANGGI